MPVSIFVQWQFFMKAPLELGVEKKSRREYKNREVMWANASDVFTSVEQSKKQGGPPIVEEGGVSVRRRLRPRTEALAPPPLLKLRGPPPLSPPYILPERCFGFALKHPQEEAMVHRPPYFF